MTKSYRFEAELQRSATHSLENVSEIVQADSDDEAFDAFRARHRDTSYLRILSWTFADDEELLPVRQHRNAVRW
jgi:hypothetical protein